MSEAESKGERRKQLEIARKMLPKMPDEEISSFTQLSVEEVAQLRKDGQEKPEVT